MCGHCLFELKVIKNILLQIVLLIMIISIEDKFLEYYKEFLLKQLLDCRALF